MVDGEFSFSVNMASGRRRPRERSPRYIAVPFDVEQVGREALIRPAGTQSVFRLPLFHAQLLGSCDALVGLHEHQRRATERFGLGPQHAGAVQAALDELVKHDLLRDEAGVFESLRARAPEEPVSPLQTLFIRTCDRPNELERLISELAHVVEGAELDSIVVLDDSRSETAIARNAEIIERARQSTALSVSLVDRTRRSRLVAAIAEAAEADPDALAWAVEGDDEDLPSYGAGLNLALLLGAGQRIALIDDDAGLTAYANSPLTPALALKPHFEARSRLLDPGPTGAESGGAETDGFSRPDVNPLTAHAEVLGRSSAALVGQFGPQNGLLLANLTPGLLHDLSRASRVRLSTNGTLGDSGAGAPTWILAAPAETLAAWIDDPDGYRRAVLGRRSARFSDSIEVAPGVGLMTTTLTGVDARDLLLPTLPRGRGEDLFFGALVEYLHPRSLTALLPWMLRHRVQAQAPWSPDALRRARGADRAPWLVEQIDDFSATVASRSPERRALALGAWFSDLAASESSDLVERLREYLIYTRARRARATQEARDNLQPPDWMAADFDALIAADLDLDATAWQGLDEVAHSTRRFARGYGESLPAWCKAWRWCADFEPESILARAG